MNIFDAHCDTLYEISKADSELYNNRFNIDFRRTSVFESYAQFFAAWIENEENAWEKFYKMADTFDSQMEKNKNIAVKCKCYKDLKRAREEKKNAAFFTLEGAYMVRETCDIDKLYDRGVRCVTLTWNGANRLAGGVDSDEGITELGYEAIARIQELGIIADVSHLNERSFWNLAEQYKKPFIASHSNAFSLCRHKRNLTDEQFRAVCISGGCAGINFYSLFLNENGEAAIEDIVKHIRHFINIGGEDHIGFGTDFDGVDSLPVGVNGVEDMPQIIKALKKAGLSDRQVEKIAYLNFERVVKEVLG